MKDYTLADDVRERIGKMLALTAIEARPCLRCGRQLYMLRMKSGKTAPYTDDAVNHFADCPQADAFRRPA